MNKLLKKKHFIGVDISKNTLDIARIEENHYGAFDDNKVKNSFKGFNQIIKWLENKNIQIKDCIFCMEHTGNYGLIFFAWLSQMDIDYCVEPALRIKRSLGITRGKNDKLDARRIADYTFINKAKLKLFKMPSVIILKIKQLLTYRSQLVRIRTSLKNSLKSHETYQKVSGLENITKQIEEQIQQQDKRVVDLEKQIENLILKDPKIKKNFDLATSVTGIGLVITSFMIVTTNNFTSFENGRKYACYAGIAPFEHSSGTSIKGKNRVSHLGNKTIKALLTNGANSAIIWDPELKTYYKRKESEGKEYRLIINSIRCKLVNRVFSTIKRQTPYVKIYQHNFQ